MLKSNRRLRDEVVGLGGSSIRSEEQASSGSPVPRTPEKSRAGGGGGGGGARGGGEEKIFVTVRVRPLSSRELARGDVADWECPDEHTVLFKHPLPDRSPYPASYAFDRVFGPDCPTQRVYEEGAKDVALSSLTGLNSTIFAYGQTSSGKTFTMRGVTETAVRDIYSLIEKNQERNFVLKVSALEIYNEIVKDLLNPDSGPLRLLDDPDRGTVVERLQEEIVRDANHLRQIISICEAQRQVGETSLNDTSSRSHQIIRLTVESSPRIQDAGLANALVASLNFVDLAGSERASQTQSEGARLKEGCHINRSLLTLSTCIRKLSAGGKAKGHIPYRDSKLTRILQHSLGGNARTAIICTMSPAHTHVEQTRNTLFFATRAKEVTNSAHVNLVVSDKVLVKQLQREVARLEAELRVPDSPSSTSSTAEALLTSEALLQAKEEQIRKMELEMREIIRQRDAAQVRLNEVTERMKEAEQQAEQRKKELEQQAKELQALESPCRLQTPTFKTQGQLPSIPSSCESYEDSATNNSRALVVVRRNLADDLEGKHSVRSKGSTLRQSNSASLMLVQEIRKLEHLQDELGEDANRALEALQKEVECLRLAQAGMNQDAAQTIKKLQEEIRNTHALRQATTSARDADGAEPQPPVAVMNSMNKSLRQELTRLQAMGENDKNEANATIATLEEQLESVQKSLDKLVLQENPQDPPAAADEDSKTPTRRKKSVPQNMSGSSRQRLMAGSPPCSPQSARKKYENNENTPPRGGRDVNASPHLGDSVSPAQKQRTPGKGHMAEDGQGTLNSKDSMYRRSNSVDIRKMQNLFKTAAEDNIKSIRAYVTELKERVAKLQYQKQLLVCQVLELEANTNNDEEAVEEEPHVEVAPVVPWSPSAWRKQYEKQRRVIIELWDACQVSIIHRTQFYLLFKGDPADAIYLEVELRRLNWLQENSATAAFEATHSGYQSASSEDLLANTSPLSAGLRNLKREREMLAKRMRSRMNPEEREELFGEWGIPLEAKQRKLQLCNKIWMDPYDMDHVQASAEVVARIVGFWEPGSAASKEMFELNFAPQSQTKNPLVAGWNQITTLLNI
ncbi:centromeric protein E [Marchantia polymorpha subsp. ruderalis]|uniref:Kinesin motor domain-containing protein n=2 Tax=Marchantia polymorpha TaxID=3197 RepID=A0A176VDR9_MARPO|nr:hypothetical protein AXG93_4448s1180 [Marchantia polymorpha subsp. ruderalis]PTQ43426.1 hypothetical protein MARPO_0025s0108 [Marchantia polymorpha]BBN03706.1 hypothetical protein Mp_2g25700 [Marchantia polymorpha subsp. ruderalis]|eukprot:PTQ43426.1 hypothetical protein MARPO_0025s0108 [Marchantia polymorpha]